MITHNLPISLEKPEFVTYSLPKPASSQYFVYGRQIESKLGDSLMVDLECVSRKRIVDCQLKEDMFLEVFRYSTTGKNRFRRRAAIDKEKDLCL